MLSIPDTVHLGQHFTMRISELMAQYEETLGVASDPVDERRRVMGFPLPSWQRPLVWHDQQKIKFIESIWLGMPLGSYTMNIVSAGHPLDMIVIDGQQRLSAIQSYLDDELEVFGGRRSDVGVVDRRRFKGAKFARYETQSVDESYLRSYYDIMNFGGVPHSPDQRASCEDEISRIEEDGLGM